MSLVPALMSALLAATSPAAATAQVPAADPRLLIFFDWDKPEIDRDGAARLDAIAAEAGRDPAVRLLLTGHADRSGPEGPNRRAGLRRAEAVRDYLMARGVARGAMRLRSLGEAQPLIPTADGVREPQNRRVDIVIMRAGD